jgi:hypothetical protein
MKGEKEWYFFCPRDRKYRNSARPNRVTGSGFWKATGTDRPIYSGDVNKCIGLKKSLVFYTGRAAKSTKTDWMMHEFRMPVSSEASSLGKFRSDEAALQQVSIVFSITSKLISSAIVKSVAVRLTLRERYQRPSECKNLCWAKF